MPKRKKRSSKKEPVKRSLESNLKDIDIQIEEILNLDESTQKELLDLFAGEYSKLGSSHYCNALNCKVVDPCQLTSCPFNYKSADNLNCTLHMKSELGDELKAPDLIGIYGKSDREVKRKFEIIFNKFRREMLKKTLDTERANRFDYAFGSKVCVSCGNLSDGKKAVEKYDLHWCSKDCKSSKPQWCIELEIFYRSDIRTILYHARHLFKKLTLIASIFKVRRTILLNLYFEFFGIKPSEFGLEAVDNVDLLRNPKSHVQPELILTPTKNFTGKYDKLEKECDKLIRTL